MPNPKPKKRLPINLQSLARSYTEQTIQTLGGIMMTGESEAARVSACGMLLDRGWGKPVQPVEGHVDQNIEIIIRNIIRGEPQKVIEASYTKKDNDDDQS